MKTRRLAAFLYAPICLALTASAQVKPSALFSDHAVLQNRTAAAKPQ